MEIHHSNKKTIPVLKPSQNTMLHQQNSVNKNEQYKQVIKKHKKAWSPLASMRKKVSNNL